MTDEPKPSVMVAEDARECPFCAEIAGQRQLAFNEHAAALRDEYPLSPGHTLVVPVDHVADLFELAPEAQVALWRPVSQVRGRLFAGGSTAFTIGANVGRAAGQTIDHAHVHVIPRATGDVENPRGGIRCVIPVQAFPSRGPGRDESVRQH